MSTEDSKRLLSCKTGVANINTGICGKWGLSFRKETIESVWIEGRGGHIQVSGIRDVGQGGAGWGHRAGSGTPATPFVGQTPG